LLIILFLFIEIFLGYYVIKYTFRTKQQFWTYQNDGEITSIATTSTGTLLGIGDENGSTSLVARGKSTPRWRHRGASNVVSIMLSDVGDYLVTLDSNDTLSLFSQSPRLRDGQIEPLWRQTLPSGKIGGIYSSGGAPSMVYVLASSGGNIRLFSKSGEILWEYPTGAEDVVTVLSADGIQIAAGDSNGNMHLFKVGSESPLWSFPIKSKISSIAVSFNSRYIAVGGATEGEEGYIYLFSRDGKVIYHRQADRPVRTVHISYDGRNLIADMEDGTAFLVSRDGDTVREDALLLPNGVRTIKLSPFGSFLAASNPDSEIYLRYLPRPAPLWRFSVPGGEPLLAITRKGDSVFVSASDRVYLLSNARSSEMIPGSRIGWAIVFFLGISMVFWSSIVERRSLGLTQIERRDYLTALLGFFIGAMIGLIITKDVGKAVSICGIGSALATTIGSRGKSISSFISSCYLGCFGSGAAGYMLGFLIWFSGDERNIIQLTLLHLFNGLKTGVIFGPLGATVGTFFVAFIIPRFLNSRQFNSV